MKSKIGSVLVIGAGTMGQQIALQIARSGRLATLLDVSAANLEKSKSEIVSKLSESQNGNIVFFLRSRRVSQRC